MNKQFIYYDMTTKNESFIKMHNYLKSKNVDNNKFMLATYNKELIGKDPIEFIYDVDEGGFNIVNVKKLQMVYDECKSNIWYFYREVFKLHVYGSGGSIPFVLNEHTMNALWLFTTGNSFLLTSPRATGRSTLLYSMMTYFKLFDPNKLAGFFNVSLQENISDLNSLERIYFSNKMFIDLVETCITHTPDKNRFYNMVTLSNNIYVNNYLQENVLDRNSILFSFNLEFHKDFLSIMYKYMNGTQSSLPRLIGETVINNANSTLEDKKRIFFIDKVMPTITAEDSFIYDLEEDEFISIFRGRVVRVLYMINDIDICKSPHFKEYETVFNNDTHLLNQELYLKRE